jgi:hypothetical protein
VAPFIFEKSLNEGWNFLIENAVKNFPGFEGVVITEGFWGDVWDGVKTVGGKVVDVVGGALDTVATGVKKAGSWLADNTVVGGWVANAAAANLEVSPGKTLEDMLLTDGDYVAAELTSGDIVVAGKTAADTGSAARALITALEGLLA